MPEHVVRQGDTLIISGVLSDANGDPVSGAGATYEFAAGPIGGGELIIDYAAADNDQTGASGIGAWSYEETPISDFPVGLYECYIRATYADDSVVTYPNDDYPGDGPILLRVTPKLPVAATVPLASTKEFEERLGVSLTGPEHKRAHALLMRASEIIRDFTGQTLSLVEGDVLATTGIWGSRLRLPGRPVSEVTAVTVDGVTLDTDTYYLEGSELVRGVGWGGPLAALSITYTHGYDALPNVVSQTAIEMVVRVWVNPGSVQSENIAGVQTAYNQQSTPAGLMLTDEEERRLTRLVATTAGDLQLR